MKESDLREQEGDGDEAFLSRWSRRKQAALQPPAQTVVEQSPPEEEPVYLTDADMPPLESLDENADYSGFLSPKVTEELRQLALQQLFRSACFNVCDGLDDYADDFTSFEKLGNVMTADLRFRLQQEAEKAAAKLQSETPQTGPEEREQAVQLADQTADVAPAQPEQASPQTLHNDPDSEEITT